MRNTRLFSLIPSQSRKEYEIVAVFKTVGAALRASDTTTLLMRRMRKILIPMSEVKELALYDTGVTAEYGDRLITLSTCEYSAQNGRLVVVAKRVGRLNANPLGRRFSMADIKREDAGQGYNKDHKIKPP